MAITSNRVPLSELISRNEDNFVVLPNFQRKFVWKEASQRALIASIIADLPIGSLLILKGKSLDFAARALCLEKEVTPKEECEYVLDGQQRLSTLKTAFFDLFRDQPNWKSSWEDVFGGLRTRWCIHLTPPHASDDCFGYEKLEVKPLSNFEQDDIVPYIITEKVRKTDTAQWFHPGFAPKDANGQPMGPRERANEVGRLAAQKRLVPLYELYRGDSGVHRDILKKISQDRAQQLAALCADGKLRTQDFFGDDVDPANFEQVKAAWLERALNWAINMAVQLEAAAKRELPTIALDKSEIKRAVCIFEAVNRGGTALAVYDLIVARAAREERRSLTERIKDQLQQPVDVSILYEVAKIKEVQPDGWTPEWIMALEAESDVPSKEMQPQIVNMISLAAYCKIGRQVGDEIVKETPDLPHIKKEKHLSLVSSEINQSVNKAMQALSRAFAFLQFRCGIRTISDIPYSLMVLPIAFVLYEDNLWGSPDVHKKIEQWYWISLLGGRYRERQNEVCIDDTNSLFNWCAGLGNFDLSSSEGRILNYEGYSDKAILLRDDPEQRVPAAVCDGILQFILASEPMDFAQQSPLRINAWGIASEQQVADIHHLVPLKHAAKLSESTHELRKKQAHILNSPLNLTWILREANKAIGPQPPSTYLSWLPKQVFPEHCLPSEVDFQQASTLDDDAYYRQLLERRYDGLRNAIQRRLNELRK